MQNQTSILKKINKKIEIRNKIFETASKTEKRILIAKDIMAQIKSKKFKAVCGIYTETSDACVKAEDLDSTSLQVGLEVSNVICECCAKGAIVLSKIRFANEVDIYKNIERNPTIYNDPAKIKDIFSIKQLDLMESAFEVEDYKRLANEEINERLTRLTTLVFSKKQIKAIKFGSKFKNANDRLIAIMENVIKNKGAFIP